MPAAGSGVPAAGLTPRVLPVATNTPEVQGPVEGSLSLTPAGSAPGRTGEGPQDFEVGVLRGRARP